MVSINQKGLAEHLGISRSLVSMALANSPLVAEETKRRVEVAAAELGYVRDLGAATLAGGRATVVGVLVPNLRNSFFEGIVEPIERYAEANGLTALMATTGSVLDTTSSYRERERRVVRKLRELRAAGMIVITPAGSVRTLHEYARLFPAIVIGSQKIGGMADTVHVSEPAAAELIVARALERGATRIANLAISVTGHDDSIAYRAFCLEEAARGKLKYLRLSTVDAAVRLATGADRLAIAAHNDQIAINLVAALRAVSIRVGQRVQVIGFDDTHLAQMPEFDLTSISQNSPLMAQEAVQLLLSRLENPKLRGREVVVAPMLSVRSSG
ncbi:MAG: LacI family transcriptional regulator [Propionibacteriaceae bacterium]|jgi:DNA-binding LacI/PurR family transcriptional regulator|nr:LacI family transcriptional regulator [Propionibacteriaceae bacterium]